MQVFSIASLSNLNRSGLIASAFVLAACGGSTPEPTPNSNAADTPAISTNSPVNTFSLSVHGTHQNVPTPSPDTLTLVGGCDGNTIVQFTFYASTPQNDNWFSFAFDTADVVDTGDTGTFAISEMEWADGVFVPEGLPTDANVKVPNQFEGSGTLILNRHEATLQSRRMVGTIEGGVSNDRLGETAEISVQFDINMSCGVL